MGPVSSVDGNASVDGNEDAVPRRLVDSLGEMALAPGVLHEHARLHPAHLAVAGGELHARVQVDDVLAPRCGMPVEVVLAGHLAEDDASGGLAGRYAPGGRGRLELDLDVLEVRLALRVGVEPDDLHRAPSRAWPGR